MKINKWDGKPISKPGWYSDVPIEKYHGPNMCAGPAVSSSNLRTCWLKSPAHVFHTWAENPNREERDSTSAMVLGAVSHHVLLGEDDFLTKYVAQPESYPDKKTGELKPWTYAANTCKDWRAQQVEAGRTVVTVKQLDAIVGMSKSLASDALVQQGMLRGHVETSGFFKDRETDLWIKVRPDVVPTDGPDFVDLKTTTDVTSHALQYTMRAYGYHQQGGLVWEVCEALDQPFTSFWLLFAESAAPYCARSIQITVDDLARGRKQNRVELRRIADCIATGHWPGPGEGEYRELPLGHDERDRIDTRLKLAGLP